MEHASHAMQKLRNQNIAVLSRTKKMRARWESATVARTTTLPWMSQQLGTNGMWMAAAAKEPKTAWMAAPAYNLRIQGLSLRVFSGKDVKKRVAKQNCT